MNTGKKFQIAYLIIDQIQATKLADNDQKSSSSIQICKLVYDRSFSGEYDMYLCGSTPLLTVHNTEQIILRIILKINIKTLKILKMLKIKSTVGSRSCSFVNEFGAEKFSTDAMVFFCKVCNVAVASEKKFTIQQHVSRDEHAHEIQLKLNEVLLSNLTNDGD
ncbi:hypothetical protein QTP88_006774 [Uroleucon formosanum]